MLDFFYIAHFCTSLTLRNHWNESEIMYFTPKNHLKLIWNEFVRKKFRPFLTIFQPSNLYIAHFCTSLTPKNHWNESEIMFFTPKNHLKLIWKKLLRKKFRPFLTIFRPSTLKSPVARARSDQMERNPD